MELFSEFRNTWLDTIYRIIQDILENKRQYTKDDIMKRLHAKPTSEDSLYIPNVEDKAENIADMILHLPLHTSSFSMPPLRLSILEKRWLKALLVDEEFAFLINSPLRQKLLNQLDDISPIITSKEWQRERTHTNDMYSSTQRNILATYRTALMEKKQISFTPKEELQQTGQPIRLEYDLIGNTYTAWIWPTSSDIPQKYDFTTITSLTLRDTPIDGNLENKWLQFLQQNKRQLKLQLQSDNTSVERCARLFATYDIEGTVDDACKTYMFSITYYSFDQQEILEKILSLGKSVIILEPLELRQEIIRILQQAQTYYTTQTSETAQN